MARSIVERTTRRFSISVVSSSRRKSASRVQSPTYGGLGSCAWSATSRSIPSMTETFSRRSSICRSSAARLRARLERGLSAFLRGGIGGARVGAAVCRQYSASERATSKLSTSGRSCAPRSVSRGDADNGRGARVLRWTLPWLWQRRNADLELRSRGNGRIAVWPERSLHRTFKDFFVVDGEERCAGARCSTRRVVPALSAVVRVSA